MCRKRQRQIDLRVDKIRLGSQRCPEGLLSGRVVDFLLFYIGQYQWPAFNVADSAIVVGAGLLVIEILFAKSPAPEKSA